MATDAAGRRMAMTTQSLTSGMPASFCAQEVFRHAKEGLFYCILDNDFERDGFSTDLDKTITDRYLGMMSRKAPDPRRKSPVQGANKILRNFPGQQKAKI